MSVFTLNAQNIDVTRKINLNGETQTRKAAITQIEAQTGYNFIYGADILAVNDEVDFGATELTIQQALDILVKGTGIAVALDAPHFILYRGGAVQPNGTVLLVEATGEKPIPAFDSRFRPTDPVEVAAAWTDRPDGEPEPAREARPRPIVAKDYPAAYSVYTDPNLYKGIQSSLPRWAIKTNLLYGALSFTPNVGVEFATGKRNTIEVTGGYNPWNWEGNKADNKKSVHYFLQSEHRWWTCERFNGHFFGAHAMYVNYNVGKKDVPLLFKKEYQYEGWALGAGVSYGYNLPLNNRLGLEFTVGVGAAYMKHNKYNCGNCGDPVNTEDKWYFGPTKLGINLVYMFK